MREGASITRTIPPSVSLLLLVARSLWRFETLTTSISNQGIPPRHSDARSECDRGISLVSRPA